MKEDKIEKKRPKRKNAIFGKKIRKKKFYKMRKVQRDRIKNLEC